MKHLALFLAFLLAWLPAATLAQTTDRPLVDQAGQHKTIPSGDGLLASGLASGQPSYTASPGTLFGRSDVPELWQYWFNTPTYVQAAHSAGAASPSFTSTLTTTPLVGNVLIGFCIEESALPGANTGWTSLGSYSANPVEMRAVYHVVTQGDTTSQTPCTVTGGGSWYSSTVTEVSGVDTFNFVNSVQSIAFTNTSRATSTLTATTSGSNVLAIGAGGTNQSGQNVSITGGISTDTQNAGQEPYIISGHQLVASGGTLVTLNVVPANVFAGTWYTGAMLLLLQPSTLKGWHQLSNLTVWKNAGSQINPSGLLQSVNCSTGLSCSDDGLGNETMILGSVPCGDLPALTGDVTSSGCATTIGANKVTLADIAQISDHTVLGNLSGGTANVSALTLPASCNGTNDALYMAGNNSFGCHAPSGAGGGTVTSVTCGGQTITSSGTCSPYLIVPQGRLTLVTGTPVMNSDQTAKSQVFYDCYVGKIVPYYDGSTDQAESISSCEVSMTMATSGTGVTNNAGVFDVWWVHSGASRICVATNGSGGGWASDTGGSNTARGTGYSQIHNTRGYWTNVNSITHCYNGATDYGSISADQATYLGTLYTTAAGQTGMQFQPAAAAGGSNPCMCLYNAYNRIRQQSIALDSTGSWSYSSTTWRQKDSNSSNRVSWVDGLGQSTVYTWEEIYAQAASGAQADFGIDEDSTTAVPPLQAVPNVGAASGYGANDGIAGRFAASSGFHYAQAMEAVVSGTVTFFNTVVGAPFSNGNFAPVWVELDN